MAETFSTSGSFSSPPAYQSDERTSRDDPKEVIERQQREITQLRDDLARAEQRGREVEVGLQAAIHLDGGVAGADDALALTPGGQRRNLLAKERVEASDNPVIEAYQT